jgi:hypothetical protein
MILAILPMARIWNYWKSKYEYFGLIAVWTMILYRRNNFSAAIKLFRSISGPTIAAN